MSNIVELIKRTKDLTVLYVEDEESIRVETQRFLSRFFSSLYVCSNGKEAWGKMQQKSFDIVITDLKMPVMDGIELIKKIESEFPKVITIAVSGLSDTDAQEICVDYRLCKPVNIFEFTKMLEEILERLER